LDYFKSVAARLTPGPAPLDTRHFTGDFALAPALTFRNLFIMRQLLLVFALMSALSLARAAETGVLKTNTVNVGIPGKLEIVTPADWTLLNTNLSLSDNPLTFELHAPSNALVIRFFIRWDGFGGKNVKPTEADMGTVVSNNIVAQYMPVAVEKRFDLEKFHGPAVNGIFGRVTDRKWTPVLKDTYPNLAEGMFRCGSIWGNFSLLTSGKDGPQFKAGLKVLESLRRKP
jgi:hypothetical protein